MRRILLRVVGLLLFATSACASSQEYDRPFETNAVLSGRFIYAHDIQMNYPSAAKCKQAGGRWVTGRDRISRCLFAVEDEVNIIPQKNTYLVSITVSGNNAHQCDFEGPGHLSPTNAIEAEDNTSANCKLQLRFPAADKVVITEKSACSCPEGTKFNFEAQRAP